MSRGSFIAVVGASGVGKDTLIEAALAARPDILMARRVITRPPAPGTEDFDSLSEAAFARMKAEGALALDWQAHGLSYGIHASVERDLAAGRHVLANLSRRSVAEAEARFDPARTILVTAPVAVRAERLARRGREDEADIRSRLERVVDTPLPGAHVVDNGGTLADGIAGFIAALPPVVSPADSGE